MKYYRLICNNSAIAFSKDEISYCSIENDMLNIIFKNGKTYSFNGSTNVIKETFNNIIDFLEEED